MYGIQRHHGGYMKKKYLSYFLLIGLLIAASAYILVHYDKNDEQKIYANAGEINLEGWDQGQDKTIKLAGEWIFFPKTLAAEVEKETTFLIKEVPHWWEEDKDLKNSPYGYATYVLTLKGLDKDKNYAIDIIDVVTAYTLYVNDKMVVSNGEVGKSKETSLPQWKQETGIVQADSNGCAKIVIELSNYDYYRGGLWNTPSFGLVEDVLNSVQKQKVTAMFLFAVIISCAFFNIGLYMVYKKNKTTIYFALFCIATAVQTILVGQRVINYFLPIYNWSVMVRLEYLSGYLMLPFFVLFFIHCVLDESEMIWMKKFFYWFIGGCFVMVLIPNHMYSSFLIVYKWASFLIALCLACIVYQAMRKKHGNFILMLFAMEVMILAILKENTIGGTVSWVPYATLVFVVVFSYITLKQFLEVVREKEVLEAKILVDPLTGLYNRNYLKELELKSVTGPNNWKRYFMFLDLDNFKEINDTYGHKIGDFILRETGRRFHRTLSSYDIICRYGGDEFICIVMAEDVEHVEEIAQNIINEIYLPFVKGTSTYQVGISIGICPEKNSIHAIEDYIKVSDEAMYQAKKNGKNRYVIITQDK